MSVPKSNISSKSSRASKGSYASTRDLEFQFFTYQTDLEYPAWWNRVHITKCFHSLPDDTFWNCFICIMAILAIVWAVLATRNPYVQILDVVYNVAYAVHVCGMAYKSFAQVENVDVNFSTKIGFVIDVLSYLHYALAISRQRIIKLICYYLRLHRPFRYLWALHDYNLKGSVLGTALKYCYIFFVLRVTWALVWLHIDEFERQYSGQLEAGRALNAVYSGQQLLDMRDSTASQFLNAFYIINKMFIPIGPSVWAANDVERIACLAVMMSGCLVLTGAAVASLSSVISIYMRPEEAFRARYRLIIKEMQESHVPPSLRDKVETFYRMYWHKQRAVSATQLLPIYPPSLPATIFTDIYFKATQKSRILCDLSYQFLSEVAKKMETIHYIPGDVIIKRSSTKSSIIYITYGDIEMLTAEDDSTAILRMTRGTILTPCGGCTLAACGRAHVEIRAATFCTAHVLRAADLWRVALKYGRTNGQAATILAAFYEHFKRVKRHYYQKIPLEVKYKSSILNFKRNLMALKEAKDFKGELLLSRTDVFLEIAGCYIMRNRADASLTDEADAICLRPTFPCILQPTSSLQVAWHSFVACLIVAVCIVHPYYLVFTKTVPLEFRFFDYVVTAVYTLDLIVHLSTGANVEEGVPITFSQTSSQQMRSHWFVLDVLGTLPIFEFISDGHFAGINKLLRLPKVFRVLKETEDLCVYHSNVLRFLSYTLLLLIACYLIAALQQGFMCYQFDYCLVTNFTHSPYWEHKPLDESTVESRLTFGLFWAISMITFTTHMETWGTKSWNAVFYTMCVLEVCVVLHIFIEAVYSATIMVTTALREDYDACIANVKNFLIRNKVDPMLRHRFITYLQLCWYTDKAYSMTNKQRSIFYDLPPHVYQDIVTRQRSKYILCIPFMKLLYKEDLKNVSTNARLYYTSPNEILLNTGDISNEMYVIKQGICEILSPSTKSVVGTLGTKSHFGVLECMLRLPAYYTVRAVTHVQVFSISRKHLLKAIEIPQIRDAIDFAKEQAEYSRLQLYRESFISYIPPPPTPNRECFRLPRKHEQDFDFLHPFKRLGFLAVSRYIFPRFTIRPDGHYLTRYEWFRASCAMSSAMLFPSYAYLVLQWSWLYSITLLLDVSAYFDILQRMLVGYFNERGILVYHPASTAAHYLKGAFIVDLFACLPLENLETPQKETYQNSYRVSQTTQFLMLNRLLQLYRLPGALHALHQYIARGDIMLVIKAVPLFLALLNVLTCLVVFYSVDIFHSMDDDSWTIVPRSDVGGSWINLFNNAFRFNLTETPWNLHLGSYFWIVYEATTTGYNNLNASNFDLMQVLFLGMAFGAMMTTYVSVRIISIRANVNTALATYQENMKDMVLFMRRERLDEDLQKQVLDHYQYNWYKMGGVDYRNVLKLCDQITLRTDAILHLYGPTFAKCPILSQCDVSLLRILGRAVHSVYFLRLTRLIEQDDIISEVYFVDSGCVEVKNVKSDDEDFIKLNRGSVFGNLTAAATARCDVTLAAASDVHLLQISALAFYHVLSEFPATLHLMDKYRPNYENFIMGEIGDTLGKVSKERTTSSPVLLRGRRGLAAFLSLNSARIHIYLVVISLLCVYADVYNAGFQDNRPALIVCLYALDMGFYLKIVMQYSLPHIVEDENTRKNLLVARKTYFKGEFRYDIVSCLPIELLSFLGGDQQWLVFSWLRLNRMLRIVTVYKCLRSQREQFATDLILMTVVSVLVWFTVFVHTATCLWYFIGVMEEQVDPKSSWLYNDEGKPWCNNLYVCSLYFVLTTFTQNGIGDIMPKKQSEVVFVSILQIISTMVYMVYVGEFSNIIQYQSFRSFSFYCKYLELQEFLKNNRVSKNLVCMTNKYTLHLWREARGMQMPRLLSTAPACLKLRVMSAAYMDHLTQHPIFKDCETAFLRQLVGYLQLYTYNEDMYVVKENEITDSMYLIHTGRVRELAENEERTLKIYAAGGYFGMGLTHDIPYTHSYRTVIKSQILTLHFTDWEYLLKHFPSSKDTIYKQLKYDDNRPDDGKDKHERKQVMVVKPGDNFQLIPSREISERYHLPTDHMSVITTQPPRHPSYTTPPANAEILTGITSLISSRTDSSLRPPIIEPDMGPVESRQTSSTENIIKDEQLDKIKVFEKQGIESTVYDPKYSTKGEVETALEFDNNIIDVDEETSSPTSLLDKVTKAAKKLVGQPSTDIEPKVTYLPSEESSVKDILLLEEDEENTTTLIEKIEEAARQSRGSKIPEKIVAKVSKESIDVEQIEEDAKEELLLTVDMTKEELDTITEGFQQTTESSSGSDQSRRVSKSVEEYMRGTYRAPAESFALASSERENTQRPSEEAAKAPSTSKKRSNKRAVVHVRYEDDTARSLPSAQSRKLTVDKRSMQDLSTQERNIRSLDSDLEVNRPESVPPADEVSSTGSSSAQRSDSSTEKSKRKPTNSSQ